MTTDASDRATYTAELQGLGGEKIADKVDIQQLILCDFEDIYIGREGNK